MIKSNNFSTSEYAAPSCKTISVALERSVLGDSGWGNSGQPGGGFDDDNTHEYEDL